ncbi:MAG TPA: DUF4157 domain-containing protein [Pyrinomonadaceae bacterium]
MALKNKTRDIEKASTAHRAPEQKLEPERASNERLRPTNAAASLQRAVNSHPSALRPADLLALQRTIGNRAVGRFFSNRPQALPSQSSAPANALQMKTEEEEPVQAKLESTRGKENRTGLPDKLKAGVERLSGIAMDDVRVHYNSTRPAEVQALAYTQGTDIHVGPGQEEHLPHEAWHVVQQKQGRVKPTLQAKEVAINDDQGLEREADVMGARAKQPVGESLQTKETGDSGAGRNKQTLSPVLALLQRRKVRPASMALDLNHEQADRLFDDTTMTWRNGLGRNATRADVEANRDTVPIHYKQIRNQPLKSAQGLRSWLGTETEEYMYVHEGTQIYTGDRKTEAEKLPHPTLVGGDPDAKGAGTMKQVGKTITITNESGHFRPPKVSSDTVAAVKAMVKNVKPKITVEKHEI